MANRLRNEFSGRIDQHLDSYLISPPKVVQSESDLIDMKILGAKDFKQLGQLFWKQMQLFDIGYVLYGFESGDLVSSGYYYDDKPPIIGVINQQKNKNDHVYIWETDDRGNRTKVLEDIGSYPFEQEGWYQAAIAKGKPTWSPVYNWEVEPYTLSVAANRPIYVVVIAVPESYFMAQIDANTRSTIMLCLLALGIAIASGFYTSRWITKPILQLNHASEAIASGKLDQKVDEKIKVNELSVLGSSFNHMADQLRSSFNALAETNIELEKRVEERTNELMEAKAISQKMVEMMGGKLQVESELNKGSTFWFEIELKETASWQETNRLAATVGKIIGFKRDLPLRDSPLGGFTDLRDTSLRVGDPLKKVSRVKEQSRARPSATRASSSNGAKGKVLVVDDRWENTSVVVNLLEPIGFETMEAENGSEGLAKALEWQPDVIITDLTMPVMDGHQMLAHLHLRTSSDISADLIVIVSSANVFESDRQKSLEAGANDFLPKPVQQEVLLQLLQKHLNLEWIYEQAESIAEPGKASENIALAIQDGEIIPPSTEEVNILLDLSRKGLINDLLKEIDRIEELDPQFRLFTQTLRDLAKGFRLKQIKSFIEQFL